MTKREFIPQFLEIIRRLLDKSISNEGSLYELDEEARMVMREWSNKGEGS